MIGGHVWLFYYNLLVHSMYSSYLLELSMFNICKKVYVLQLKLVTKFVTFFYLSTDPQVKMSLKLLPKTLN